MSIKVSVWDKILKVIIAVASAIAGVIGGQAIRYLGISGPNMETLPASCVEHACRECSLLWGDLLMSEYFSDFSH